MYKVFYVSDAKITTACQLCDSSQKSPCCIRGEVHSAWLLHSLDRWAESDLDPVLGLLIVLTTADTFSSYGTAVPVQSADSGHTMWSLKLIPVMYLAVQTTYCVVFITKATQQ